MKQYNEDLKAILICEGSSWSNKDFSKLSEESKEQISERIVTKLFRDIKAKSFKLDFSDFEVSKGDITKINNYSVLHNAINFLIKMENISDDLRKHITEIDLCFKSLEKYKKNYMDGFRSKNRMIEYLYNSICLSLVQGVSYLIAISVEITKTNMGLFSYEIKNVNKVPKNGALSAIKYYTNMEKSGQLVKCMQQSMRIKKEDTINFLGNLVSMVFILPISIIRMSVMNYFYIRIRLSNYFDYLANFLYLNASTLTNSNQKNVKNRQEKIANKLKEMSKRISIDQNMATDRAEEEIKQNDKEISSQTNKPEGNKETEIY